MYPSHSASATTALVSPLSYAIYRFVVEALARICCLRRYRGRLSYLKAPSAAAPIATAAASGAKEGYGAFGDAGGAGGLSYWAQQQQQQQAPEEKTGLGGSGEAKEEEGLAAEQVAGKLACV